MKRSDMSYIVENVLADNKDKLRNRMYADVATILLSKIQSLGMVPPTYSDLILGKCEDNYLINAWEEEND